jgi:ArsR family transcriptional regulator
LYVSCHITHSGDYFHPLRRYFHKLPCTYLKVDICCLITTNLNNSQPDKDFWLDYAKNFIYAHISIQILMNQTEKYVELFKALSDETRLSLIVLLHKKELCVCQIEAALDISQTKASRHLAILRRAGLLKARREGLWVYYTLEKPATKVEANLFESLSERLYTELSSMEDRAKKKTCLVKNKASVSKSE